MYWHQSHQLSPFTSIAPRQVAFTHDFAEILRRLFLLWRHNFVTWPDPTKFFLPKAAQRMPHKLWKISARFSKRCGGQLRKTHEGVAWTPPPSLTGRGLRAYSPTVEDILSESLWFSDHTKFKDKMIRQWDGRGLRFINDLFNRTTGVLHSKATLEKQFNLKLTFMCFESLVRSFPEKVRTYKAAKLISPGIPWIIQMVLSKNNLGHFAYDMLVNKTFCNAEPSITRIREKWVRDTGINIENDFIEVTNATKATRLKYFHFKIVNRIISTNVFLERIGAIDDDSCFFFFLSRRIRNASSFVLAVPECARFYTKNKSRALRK